mmetsp:Transcript_25158/g.47304  ORF Transcript_25158/g.47304 Transcript_25158/m.47304 type:complete len:281 (-) Transcript_25158:266-1108(-)
MSAQLSHLHVKAVHRTRDGLQSRHDQGFNLAPIRPRNSHLVHNACPVPLAQGMGSSVMVHGVLLLHVKVGHMVMPVLPVFAHRDHVLLVRLDGLQSVDHLVPQILHLVKGGCRTHGLPQVVKLRLERLHPDVGVGQIPGQSNFESSDLLERRLPASAGAVHELREALLQVLLDPFHDVLATAILLPVPLQVLEPVAQVVDVVAVCGVVKLKARITSPNLNLRHALGQINEGLRQVLLHVLLHRPKLHCLRLCQFCQLPNPLVLLLGQGRQFGYFLILLIE